jgi:predicted  nucleic acid-binding Zn-ribbon protein
MELTKDYFDEQLKSLATKKDISDIQSDVTAINQRIDSLPTHADLEKFATKDDLLELATKTDLNSVRDDIAEVKELVQRIDQRTDEDHRAALRDIADLKHRVSVLEKSAARQ